MSSRAKANLKLDWCSHAAAKYACERWHYSGTMPVSKSTRVGVWESSDYVGAVIFAWGANPNLSKPYGLEMVEVAELVRVALREHENSVSRIISVALRMLRNQCPGLRLCVSYADSNEGHHGGIYQAGGWIYTGMTSNKFDLEHNGRILQRRAYTGANFGQPKMKIPTGAVKVFRKGKHRYLYPLDKEMRERILPLAKPYPKRAGGVASDASNIRLEEGGAIPTPALQVR